MNGGGLKNLPLLLSRKDNMVTTETIQNVDYFLKHFNCQRCGKCCTEGKGVALLSSEIRRLKEIIPIETGISWSQFKDEHTYTMNGWRLLKFPCALYIDNKCSIYNNRPTACRLYPLGVTNKGNILKSFKCPVMNTKLTIN